MKKADTNTHTGERKNLEEDTCVEKTVAENWVNKKRDTMYMYIGCIASLQPMMHTTRYDTIAYDNIVL